jgi:predicted Zn-dependent protease
VPFVALSLLLVAALPRAAPADDVLVDRADWQEESFRTTGALLDDAAVSAYVRDVAQRVSAKETAPIRVAILRDSDAYAFALPNGALYVSVGLLTRIRTESELAAVLAREATLAVGPSAAELPTWSGRVDLGFGPIGAQEMPAKVYAASTIRGVKEEAERVADAVAVERLAAAGYDVAAAGAVHSMLAADARTFKARYPYVYADKDRMEARAQSLARLAQGRVTASPAADRYTATMRDLVRDACDRFVRFGRPELAVAALGAPGRADAIGSAGHRILADAYRQRGEKGDDALARAEYEAALRAMEPDVRAHLGLAQLAARAGDAPAAAAHYDAYLRDAASNAPERPMVSAERAALGVAP